MKDDCKIVKKVNPLGGVVYVALVKRKVFWLLPRIWVKVYYYAYLRKVSWDIFYENTYITLREAQEAIEKYREWNKGTAKNETLPCK